MNSERAGTTTNDGSSSFPGIGSAQSVAEAVVARGGAPPIAVGAEPADAAAASEDKNEEVEQDDPAGGDADEIVAEEAAEGETIAEAEGEDADADVIEGEVGPITGMETEWGDIFVSGDGKLIAPVLEGAAAICPQCGSTYDQGTAACGDCHVPLYQLS